MSTFVGRASKPASPVAQVPQPVPERKADKTRSELVEEAEALGIKVPKNANKAQIQRLIEEAPVI